METGLIWWRVRKNRRFRDKTYRDPFEAMSGTPLPLTSLGWIQNAYTQLNHNTKGRMIPLLYYPF